MSDKQFGVFDFTKTADHQLNAGTSETVRFPHSRWNEVQANELTASGYLVLTQSADGGVDSFVKKKKRSLFVHFQGHPEYGAQTLLKEYRRDVKRYLRGERETYPSMPKGYFDTGAATLLDGFREVALSDRHEKVIESFPDTAVTGTLQKTWDSSAVNVYRIWLQYVVAKKSELTAFPVLAAVSDPISRKRSELR
jgi:homoserine O-succinyltransferase